MRSSNPLIGVSAAIAVAVVGVASAQDSAVPSPQPQRTASPEQETQGRQTNAVQLTNVASDLPQDVPEVTSGGLILRQRSQSQIQQRLDNRFDRLLNQKIPQGEAIPELVPAEAQILAQTPPSLDQDDRLTTPQPTTSESQTAESQTAEESATQQGDRATPTSQEATPTLETTASIEAPQKSEQAPVQVETQPLQTDASAPEPTPKAEPAARSNQTSENQVTRPQEQGDRPESTATSASSDSTASGEQQAQAEADPTPQIEAQVEQSEEQLEEAATDEDEIKAEGQTEETETAQGEENSSTEATEEEVEDTATEDRIDNELQQGETTLPETPAEIPQESGNANSFEPAPEYLDPNPNPLNFPTSPEEVEIVGTQPITIQQAVELAIRNNPELQQFRLQVEQAQAALREAEASNYPNVDANLNLTHREQQSASAAQFQTQPQVTFQQDPANPGQLIPVPNPNAGEVVEVAPARVGVNDSTNLGGNLEVNYALFTSGRRPALIEAAQGQLRSQQLELERQTEDLVLDAANGYYDLQQASAEVNIARANLDQAEQSLRDAEALERAGVGTRFDVLQAQVDVANSRQALTDQLSQLEIARRSLARLLNISQSLSITAADLIDVAGVWNLSLEDTIVQAFRNRAELQQQLIAREVAQNQRRASLAQLAPQVTLGGSFGLTSNDFFGGDNNPQPNLAFNYNYQVALGVGINLYDGGAARAQADQQEINIAIAERQFENLQDQIRFQVEQAYSQLDSNFANIQTTALAVEQATEALRLARLRFQAGVGTQTDVLRQQAALADAQVNYLRAILNYNRALATLQRSISNFPEGYLSDVP